MRRDTGVSRPGAALSLALLACSLAVPAVSFAHGGLRNNVYAVLGKLPPALADVTVQVHQSLEPQIVLQNKTGHELRVLDAHGRAFLRIGPNGVFADKRAPAWYESRTSLKQEPVPEGVTETAKPLWVHISSTSSWGWFDARLATHDMKVKDKIVDADTATAVGKWSIPVRLDGGKSAITGTFRYIPPPHGAFQEQLTSSWQPADGVVVDLSAGRVPGLSITNNSEQVVTVAGMDDKPFLRFTDQGVYANTASRSWAQSGRVSDSTPFVGGEQAHWQQVSGANRFTWIEPRAAYTQAHPPADAGSDKPTVLRKWQIPMQIGEKSAPLTGLTYWRPTPHTHHHHEH